MQTTANDLKAARAQLVKAASWTRKAGLPVKALEELVADIDKRLEELS